MNAVNRAATAIFDWLLVPFEWAGPELALVLVSGVFGVLALLLFQRISWQAGIKSTKDRIKGHLIAIRIYQDDLAVVAVSVAKILLLNGKYLALNFGPMVPLAAPFTLVAAQLVVRYGFAPLPVSAAVSAPEDALGDPTAGETTLQVQLSAARALDVAGLEVRLPDGLVARSPLARVPSEGRAFLELAALRPGAFPIEISLPSGETATKWIVAGPPGDELLQPERTSGFWSSWLWPAEDSFGPDSAFRRVWFDYPERELRWLPDGPVGVLLTFLLAAMAFGAAVMKPLGVQI